MRLVETQENAFVNQPVSAPFPAGTIQTSAFGPYIVNHVTHNYLNVLPSLNFTFDRVGFLKHFGFVTEVLAVSVDTAHFQCPPLPVYVCRHHNANVAFS